MKKLLLFSIALLGFTLASSAQDISNNAIGLRLGDSDGLGAEISYQHALGSSNRLELDLGWRNGNSYSAYKLTGLYQWVFPLDGDFNWYVGAGAGLSSFSGKDDFKGNDSTAFFVAGYWHFPPYIFVLGPIYNILWIKMHSKYPCPY